MGFSLFRIKLVVRILLVCAAIVGFLYYVQKPQYYFTYTQLLLLAIFLMVELIYFIEKGYRQLNNMLLSIKEKDFNLTFSPVEKSKVFSKLTQLLNELTDGYRKVRIEKEAHYQFLNHIIDQVNQVIICFDVEGKIYLSNRMAKKFLALNAITTIQSFSRINSDLPKVLLLLREGEEKLLSFVYQDELLKFSASCTSVKLIDKKLKLVVLLDIRQSLQEQELESYRKLIRVLTHEIMNSVTPILSLSQAMSEVLKPTESQSLSLGDLSGQEATDVVEGYHAIEVRSQALMRFVNDFKSLTRLPTPSLKDECINDILDGLYILLKPIAEKQGVSIAFSVAPSIKTVLVDKGLFEQVMLNLIKNAIEATQGIKDANVDVDVVYKGSRLSVSVSDNGRGIPSENFDKIFVPFFSTKREGSGIGLSLSREIIRQHGGVMSFKSEENQGTTFNILLP